MIPFKSKTANLVFKLVSLQKHHTKSKQLSEEEANDAFVFSARNGLAPWIFSQSNKEEYNMIQWPENIKQLLRMQYLQTLIMNQQKWKVFRELFEIAASKNIPVIPLKGTALAFSLYPEEALRPMGDLDILVPELQVLELRNLLLSKGAKLLHMPLSELHEKVHAHISAVTWQNVMIEPHQRLFAMGNAMNLQNIDLFQHTQPLKNYPDIKIFNDRMQAYHLATHAFKGYKMGGMRLGWLLDIALILQRNENNKNFVPSIIALNPRAKKQIVAPIQWASLLLNQTPANQFEIPFPDEIMFHQEQNPKRKHKIMVVEEIASLPGFRNKTKMLFREFFPEPAYMKHQYGTYKGLSLFKLYLKRIAGFRLPRNQ